MATIKQIFGMDSAEPRTFAFAPPTSPTCPTLLYGLELEIEHTRHIGCVEGIYDTEDGSLRNEGREFITNPMTFPNLAHCLGQFFSTNTINAGNYSERTSIHVHTNCQDLTPLQVQGIIVLYQVLERVLYAWIGDDRENNIFCVPWHQIALTHKILDNPESIEKYKRWQKYTGLNLLPLMTLGTIEWRHMAGHCDVGRILEWCQLIGCIYTYALSKTLKALKDEVINLNTSSLYETFLHKVFKDHTSALLGIPNYQMLLEEGVLSMKWALSTDAVVKKKKEKVGVFNEFSDLDSRAILDHMERFAMPVPPGDVPLTAAAIRRAGMQPVYTPVSPANFQIHDDLISEINRTIT